MKKKLGIFLIMTLVGFLIWLASVSFILPAIKTNTNEVSIQEKLFFWVLSDETGRESDKETVVAGVISGTIEIKDLGKFIERYKTLHDFTTDLVEYIQADITDKSVLFLADGPSRYEFARKIIRDGNLTTSQAAEKSIRASYPWVWLYSPSLFEKWKQQPEILELAINSGNEEAWFFYVIIQHEKFLENFPKELESLEAQEAEFSRLWNPGLAAKAEGSFRELEKYFAQKNRTITYHNSLESYLLDLDLFQASAGAVLNDDEMTAFRKFAVMRWQKAKLLDQKATLQTAMDLLVMPHFKDMQGQGVNDYFWRVVISAALNPANSQIENGREIDWRKISYLLIPSSVFLEEIIKDIPKESFDGVWRIKTLSLEAKELPVYDKNKRLDKDFQPYYQYWLDKNK